ncbi:MAG: hypothetical protein DBX66_01530 [Clostridiales bacterium]|nr:MAG: hypothetical protein DBX66_01530 [Clostridiales bacterium]RGB69953.1 hypothetical protein DW086_02140 [Harryflintia acetispora]
MDMRRPRKKAQNEQERKSGMSAKQGIRNRRQREAEQMQPPKEKKTLIGSILQMPEASLNNMCQIELMSNREALVDGCKGVVEYNEDFIRLNLGNMTVRFCGRALQLRSMSEESVVIEGYIQSVDFIN